MGKMNKELMNAAGLGEYVKLIEDKKCPFCKQPIDLNSFKDSLSLQEFKISGICQECQDDFFK
jgi:transposase-like protein